MNVCPSCASEVPQGSRFCSTCGDPIGSISSQVPTEIAGGRRGGRPPSGGGAARLASSDSISDARFAPGTMLAGRYRIVGLLGRGGMGEVYRADDLTLAHPVALKFLPEEVAKDEARRSRFLGEVRIARQVSHPNVCRVYDVGEVDGMQFLSMEYVDGEDLASLLRRIGRFSRDKAAEIARQICAGLAAAHERGVIHRDLKPANVMIDGRGKVRITDFGLASVAGEVKAAELRAGTPAYMAPEQFEGREVTIRSDIYALGLVLYELFTGRRALERGHPARTAGSTGSTSPTSHVPDMDEAAERIIMRCLEPDPLRRPASALAVAAALPGGDPLAAALAAGETPSPEMVADAGEEGALGPAVALGLLSLAIAAFCTGAFIFSRMKVQHFVPLDKPPDVLQADARGIAAAAGYAEPAVDSAFGFERLTSWFEYIERTDKSAARWDRLGAGKPPALFFWYRQTPQPMIANGSFAIINMDNPPQKLAGSWTMALDTEGHLLYFEAVPPQLDESHGPWPTADYGKQFEAAGLDLGAFMPIAPEWTPLAATDDRRAWTGHPEGWAVDEVRVETASFHGKPVFFQIVGPWSVPGRQQRRTLQTGQSVGEFLEVASRFLVPLLVGLFLARRNLKAGRGDLHGAFKVFLGVLASHTVTWALYTDHVSNAQQEFNIVSSNVGYNLFLAATVWVSYVALEPYVRRRWPDVLISWSRLLSGRWRDPLVGRDMLIGAVVGALGSSGPQLAYALPGWVGDPPVRPFDVQTLAWRGIRYALGSLFDAPVHGLITAMSFLFLIFLGRVLLRKAWLAAAAAMAVFIASIALGSQNPALTSIATLPIFTLFVFVLLRYGLVTAFVAATVFTVLDGVPWTTDLGAWHATASWAGLGFFLILTILAFRTALAGRPLFSGGLLEE